MSDTANSVKVAVIGWGNFFGHVHAQTLAELVGEEVVHLRAICVRTDATREALAERFPCDYHTADAEKVLGDPEVDAIIISAPQQVQAAYTVAALKAGKYVYVEKPLFCDAVDSGREPQSFFDDFARIGPWAMEGCAVGLNKRFAPAYRMLRDLTENKWGGARHLQMTIIDDAWRWGGGRYPDGFLIWLDLCHWLDLARWWTGVEIATASCLEPQPNDAQVTLVMTNGTVVSIFMSANGTMDQMKEELRVVTAAKRCATVTDYVELEIYGGPVREVHTFKGNQQVGGDPAYVQQITDGGLDAFRAIRREVFDRFQRTRGEDPAGDDRVKANIPNFMRPQGWSESLREFIASVAAGKPLANSANFKDAYIAYRVKAATLKSIEQNGQFVDVTSASEV